MLYKPFDCRSPWVHPDFIYGLTANGRENKRLTKYVHNFADEIIQSRRTALVRIWVQTLTQLFMTNFIRQTFALYFVCYIQRDDPDILNTRRKDFLDILITARDENDKGLTAEEIRAEVDTFLFEGRCLISILLKKNKNYFMTKY